MSTLLQFAFPLKLSNCLLVFFKIFVDEVKFYHLFVLVESWFNHLNWNFELDRKVLLLFPQGNRGEYSDCNIDWIEIIHIVLLIILGFHLSGANFLFSYSASCVSICDSFLARFQFNFFFYICDWSLSSFSFLGGVPCQVHALTWSSCNDGAIHAHM